MIATSELRITQVQQALAAYSGTPPTPAPGWLKTVREALGMTTRQAAARAGISQVSWVHAESREAKGTISLAQLRKLSVALGTRLTYALVPETPLRQTVDTRAERLAREQVAAVTHTMALEDQRPTDEFIESQVQSVKAELLRGRRARLWD